MDSPEEFKRNFSFLERHYSLPLHSFHYDKEHFGNIVAKYGSTSCYIQIVQDRGLVETSISSDGSSWRGLDLLLKEIGLPTTARVEYRDDYDCFGWHGGNSSAEQAAALNAHLPAIQRHLAGA